MCKGRCDQGTWEPLPIHPPTGQIPCRVQGRFCSSVSWIPALPLAPGPEDGVSSGQTGEEASPQAERAWPGASSCGLPLWVAGGLWPGPRWSALGPFQPSSRDPASSCGCCQPGLALPLPPGPSSSQKSPECRLPVPQQPLCALSWWPALARPQPPCLQVRVSLQPPKAPGSPNSPPGWNPQGGTAQPQLWVPWVAKGGRGWRDPEDTALSRSA